jgi:hypothetical protein
VYREIRSAEDLHGAEFDWLACDADGHVALFSSAGGGYIPWPAWQQADAHVAAIDAILALPPSTAPRFAPQLGAGFENTWLQATERGLFAFDSHPNGGPYRLVAAPETHVPAAELPAPAIDVLNHLHYRHLHFAVATDISTDALQRQ